MGSKFLGHTTLLCEYSKITENIEQVWILLDKPNVRKIAVCMFYRPPDSTIDVAIKELSECIDSIRSHHDAELVIMGDINVNYRDRHCNSFELLKEFERVHNVTQLIMEYMRITSKTKSTIDLIWTDMSDVESYGVMDTHVSDHMPVDECIEWQVNYGYQKFCTKPLSTIQCNETLCQDQLVPILLIG